MPITYVRQTILLVALSLSALAAQASSGPTSTAPALSSPPSYAADAELLLPHLRDAALQYVAPARPNAMPGRETPTVYPLHWAAVVDRAATAEQLIDQGI